MKAWSYNLDAVGNETATNFVTNNLNQILESTDYVYEYNINGNRTKKTHRFNGERVEYSWTAENQLISAKIYKNSSLLKTIVYKYDAIGRRISRNVTDHVAPTKSYARKYVYDGQQVVAILDSNNELVSAYVHGEEIDDPLVMFTDYDKDGEIDVLSFMKDHLGSIRYITNENQEILEEIHYSAYGETQIKLGGTNKTRVGNNFYYTGRELEPETGDYYYRARYYDPYSQKFLSEDPIGFASGEYNLYRYVQNNPLSYSDPMGLFAWPWDILDEANKNKKSGGGEGPKNAFKHCFASCMASAEYGGGVATLLGWGMEAGQTNQSDFSAHMDAVNNTMGADAGSKTCPTQMNQKAKVPSSAACEQSCSGLPLMYKAGGQIY